MIAGAETEESERESSDTDQRLNSYLEESITSNSSGESNIYEPPPAENDQDNAPLYERAPLTVAQSILAISTVVLNHILTGSSLADILQLIQLHYPQPNFCKSRLYRFETYFSKIGTPLMRIFFRFIYNSKLETSESKCIHCKEKTSVAASIQSYKSGTGEL